MRDALKLRRLARTLAAGDAVDFDREALDTPTEWLEMMRVIQTVRDVHRDRAREAEAELAGTHTHPVGRWGPLELLEKLGEGGFGEVWRAWDPRLQRAVALKLWRLDSRADARERQLAEARALARLQHPNVLAIHGADVHDGRVGLWTDLLRGLTLEEVLGKLGPYDHQEAALAGIMLCRALAAVHAAGLVHLDVKTTNVMREHGGRIVLLDFGSAHAFTAGPASEIGTPLTMAPEQLLGGAVGPQADLYGLGVLLYRLVTLRFPIEVGTVEELRERHRSGAGFTPLRDLRPELPVNFVRIVERALSADPTHRQASAGALERALTQVLGAMTTSEIMRVPARST